MNSFQQVFSTDKISYLSHVDGDMARKNCSFCYIWPCHELNIWPLSLKFKLDMGHGHIKYSWLLQVHALCIVMELLVQRLIFPPTWAYSDVDFWPSDPSIKSVHLHAVSYHPWKFSVNMIFSSKDMQTNFAYMKAWSIGQGGNLNT